MLVEDPHGVGFVPATLSGAVSSGGGELFVCLSVLSLEMVRSPLRACICETVHVSTELMGIVSSYKIKHDILVQINKSTLLVTVRVFFELLESAVAFHQIDHVSSRVFTGYFVSPKEQLSSAVPIVKCCVLKKTERHAIKKRKSKVK